MTTTEATAPRTYVSSADSMVGSIPLRGVHVIEAAPSDETWTGNAPHAVTLAYELNPIDGWVRLDNCADGDGHFRCWPRKTEVPVRTVLDVVPSLASWVATTHLQWCDALSAAGERRRAAAQRRALATALAKHGLALNVPAPTTSADPLTDDELATMSPPDPSTAVEGIPAPALAPEAVSVRLAGPIDCPCDGTGECRCIDLRCSCQDYRAQLTADTPEDVSAPTTTSRATPALVARGRLEVTATIPDAAPEPSPDTPEQVSAQDSPVPASPLAELLETAGSVRAAAKHLGVSVPTLYRMMRRADVSSPRSAGRQAGWRKIPEWSDQDLSSLYTVLGSAQRVADVVGLSNPGVRYRLIQSGVTLQKTNRRPPEEVRAALAQLFAERSDTEQRDHLINALVVAGVRQTLIADVLGVSKQRIGQMAAAGRARSANA